MADLRRYAENSNAYGRSYTYMYVYTYTSARDRWPRIRPSLAPRLARMLEQESVSATLGSQPTLP